MVALDEWILPYWNTEQKNSDGQDPIFTPTKENLVDEYAARVRAIYRAFLLVCDPETMEPLSVTVMDGAYTTDRQSSLFPSIQADAEGNIRWEVESPYATIFSPYTSSFSIAGSSYRYTFTLTPEGKVIGEPYVSVGSGYRE